MKASRQRPTVLAVNDTRDVLELFTVLLEREGYRVVTAENGRRALELALSIEPDIVISDVVMPEMDGLEFCRRMKQSPRSAAIPVLLVSALRTADEDTLRGLVAGADDYLELPFHRQELMVKVARLTERHRVERHYRDIVEQAADIIYTRDMDGFLTSINEAGARFFGRSADTITGAPLNELLGTDVANADIEAAKEMSADVPWRVLHQARDANGVMRHLESLLTLIRDPKGRPTGVRCVARDITDRKQAEEALRESEERYRELFENANDLVYTHDLEGNFSSLNKAGELITGYTREEALALNISQVVVPEQLEHAREMITRKTVDEMPTVYELEIMAKDGHRVALELSTRIIYRDGRAVGVQGIGRDITERRRAEEALTESERRFREMLENIQLAAVMLDVNGSITFCNDYLLSLAGWQRDEVLGQDWYETFVPADQREAMENSFSGMMSRGMISSHGESEIQVRTGDRRLISWNHTLLRDPKGTVLGATSIGEDVTERVEADRRLLASIQQLETLTALATDVKDSNEADDLLVGLAESITHFTDYRSCLVVLFGRETPYYPRCLSHSENVPAEYIELISSKPCPTSSMRKLLESGVPIGVGELGFAAYFPPSHYYLLDRYTPDRFKADLELVRPAEGPRWHSGDELYVPLITHDGEYKGLIALDDPRSGRAPDRQSVLPVVALARQVTQLLAQHETSRALAHQAEREAMINRISGAVRYSLDLTEVFRTAVSELGSYLNVDRCTLFMNDDEAMVARNMAEYHATGVRPVGRDFDVALLGDLINGIEEQGVLVFDDAATDERIGELYNRFLRRVGVRSIMYIAIKVGEETPAAFVLSTTRALRHWRQTDIALAKAVADQTGIAIRQAKLFQKSEATSAREALINRLSLAIRASLNLPEVLNTATRELGRALDASRVHLRLYEPGKVISPLENEYVAPGAQSIRQKDVSYDDPVGQRLLRTLQTIVVDDAKNFTNGSSELCEHIRSHAAAFSLKSSIDCPLIVNGRFRGALCINQTDRERHWKEDEVTLVESVAAQLATGIAQAELYEMAKRARKEWETTFNAMSDGIFIFDNSGQLIRVNRAGATMEDTWPHLLLNRHCCDILRASTDQMDCIVEKTLAESRTITVEVTPERYNRPLLVTVEPIIESGNKTVGAVCTARDLSELRKVEAEARENQSLLMNILESAREAIYAMDTEGRIQWCNSATLVAGGYKLEDLIGHNFLELTFEGDRDMIRERLQSAMRGEPQTYEMRYYTNDGTVSYALVDNAPLVVDGRTTGVLGISRDITEQKQERQRASQADKLRALGQLASGVAHDFNNALAAILGRAQLMRRQTKDEGMVRNLEIIQTAAADAAATVRRIQTFARQSQAKGFELLEAGGLLRDAIEITRTRWENEARTRGLRYEVELDTEPEVLTPGSASELREVFVNLIVNAVDAMPDGGRLSITCRRVDERLLMRFIDTGTGMTEEVRERIFEPFYTTKGALGTGLGLAVSYGIIERHGGHINVESEVGIGTTFEIDLPVSVPSQVPIRPRVSLPETPPLSILVVDDEDFVRETLGEMLTVLGHRVVSASGGLDALRALNKKGVDLVFTDLSMPEMDGWEVAREIRRRWPEISVILVTGYGTNMQTPLGEQDLIDGVIGKPFEFDQVTEIIAEVINKRLEEKVG